MKVDVPTSKKKIHILMFVVLKKIRIYIIFVILLWLLKKINMIFLVCYNLKITNIYTYNFNQNHNLFIIYMHKHNKKSEKTDIARY